MVVMNYHPAQMVLSRCIQSADDDIFVPDHPVHVIGTIDLKAEGPGRLSIPADQTQQMLEPGEAMALDFRKARPLHVWAGTHPLVKGLHVVAPDTRHMACGMNIINHHSRDGVSDVLTVTGGKLTTYRLMAERIVSIMCEEMGGGRECRAAFEAMPPAVERKLYTIGHRLEEIEHKNVTPSHDQIIYGYELITRTKLEEVMDTLPGAQPNDVCRQVRLEMGPCQGGFCSQHATGIVYERGDINSFKADELLRNFLKNRWISLWSTLYGRQLRQTILDNWIHEGTLDIKHLPASAASSPEFVSFGQGITAVRGAQMTTDSEKGDHW